MFIQLDFESDLPIYEQLKNEIIIGIARKQLLPGERLPSVRSLASDIGINLHTVNKAYQQLKQEDYLLIHRQRGVVVNPEGIPKADENFKENIEHIIKPLIAASIAKGMTHADFNAISEKLFNEITFKGDDKNGK